MPSALMADTRYLCNRCVRQNTPQKSEQEKRRTVRETAQPEDSAAGAVDGYAAVREPRLRVKRDVDHADWRQCPIGRTTNRTTFVTPGKPVGDRPAAWPAARKHTGMPPPYGSDMVLPPGTGDDPAPSPKLVPISALQLSPQQDAKDLLCGLRASPGLRGRPIRINTCQIAQNRLLRVFLLRDGYIPRPYYKNCPTGRI